MGKDLKGKELGVGIVQQANGLYVARFTDKHGRRQSKRFKKLQECRQWIADATYIDEHTDIENATDMLVDAIRQELPSIICWNLQRRMMSLSIILARSPLRVTWKNLLIKRRR